jgi:hypothetical protein
VYPEEHHVPRLLVLLEATRQKRRWMTDRQRDEMIDHRYQLAS